MIRQWKIGDQITLTEAKAFQGFTMNMPVMKVPYMGLKIPIPDPPGTITFHDGGTKVTCTWIFDDTYEVTEVS